MSVKKRAYCPPTTIEDSQVVVWALGSSEHPWNNLYVRDENSTSSEDTIDVYDRLSKQISIPEFPEVYNDGILLTIDLTKSSKPLIWDKIANMISNSSNKAGEAIVTALSNESKSVPKATSDKNGDEIDTTYVKNSNYTADTLVTKLANTSVPFAKYDSDELSKQELLRKKFSDKYVLFDTYNTEINKKANLPDDYTKGTKLKPLAFSAKYSDLIDTPSLSSYATKSYVDGEIAKIDTSKYETTTAHASDMATINTALAAKVNTGTIATTANLGLIKLDSTDTTNCFQVSATTGIASVKEYYSDLTKNPAAMRISETSNGLSYTDDGLQVSLAGNSDASPGVVWIPKKYKVDPTSETSTELVNGIAIDSTGCAHTLPATTSQPGVITVDESYGLKVASGKLSVELATTEKAGTVCIGAGISVVNGIISVPSSLPVGTVVAYAKKSVGENETPDGFLVCDGQKVSKTAFSDLYNLIGNTYQNGQADPGEYFYLPKLNDNRFIEGAQTSGTYKSAGLPNIIGNFLVDDMMAQYVNGVFAKGTQVSYDATSNWDGGGTYVNFDASRYSSIYSNNVATVQPNSLTMIYLIKY